MKIKEIFENNVYSYFDGSFPTLKGQNLKVIAPYFKDIEEFKDKNIEVIESTDNLVTVKGIEHLQENIKLQSIFLIDDDFFIRCTADSLKLPNGNDFALPSVDVFKINIPEQDGLEPNTITFNNEGEKEPILKLDSNGDIFVKGRLVENDKQVVDALRGFLITQGLIKK